MSIGNRNPRPTTTRRGIRKAMRALDKVESQPSRPATADQRRVRYLVADALAMLEAGDAVLTSRNDATRDQLRLRLATLRARVDEVGSRKAAPRKARKRMRVIVEFTEEGGGTIYDTVEEAARALRVKPSTLTVQISKGKGRWSLARPHPETGNPRLLEVRMDRPVTP